MYVRDALYLSGKGAAVFADELSAAVDSGMGSMPNIFGNKHCLDTVGQIFYSQNVIFYQP